MKRSRIQSLVLHEQPLLPNSLENVAFSELHGAQDFKKHRLESSKREALSSNGENGEYAAVVGEYPMIGDKDDAVQKMHAEFKQRRKVVLNGLPPTSLHEVLAKLLKEYSFTLVSDAKDGPVRLLFQTASLASECIRKLNVAKFKGHKLAASYGHPDSLLFVGNLPFTLQSSMELRQLFEEHGEILRCFIVHSAVTGRSKGYGFVEYATRDQALAAKQKAANKAFGHHRGLRVDFADNGMQTPEDLQSSTLFVDRLPKAFTEDSRLKALFSKHGTVNFCQIALDSSGGTRGFAFVDMSSSEEAEEAQAACNGAMFEGQEIRVVFGMPCKPGACILQHKNMQPHQVQAIVKAGNLTKADTSKVDTVKTDAVKMEGLDGPVICKLSVGGAPTTSVPTLPVSDKDVSLGRKRHVDDDDDEKEEPRGVYDQPYIGQHQQGIPYLHPLKRIRKELKA